MTEPHRNDRLADVVVRREESNDAAAVREINRAAFDGGPEAQIVDRLRETCPQSLSLVAAYQGGLVGHVLFSPSVIETTTHTIDGMGLAPMAVLPTFQRQGIGSQLVLAGLDELRQAGHAYVIVLGHPEYYPRFGFVRASQFGIVSEYPNIPDEVFMIAVLRHHGIQDAEGVAKYRPEFAEAI